mmetsp:Transcript_36027/g.112631  ORF Transcript_36027/g.112631 Transcript_36027/m.112631 type:complete len:202 (+) Transcript_36027:1703-2308(+)
MGENRQQYQVQLFRALLHFLLPHRDPDVLVPCQLGLAPWFHQEGRNVVEEDRRACYPPPPPQLVQEEHWGVLPPSLEVHGDYLLCVLCRQLQTLLVLLHAPSLLLLARGGFCSDPNVVHQDLPAFQQEAELALVGGEEPCAESCDVLLLNLLPPLLLVQQRCHHSTVRSLVAEVEEEVSSDALPAMPLLHKLLLRLLLQPV